MNLMPKRQRRRPINLPLTAMIDIFSLLVIFLIKGTVFGAADVATANLKLPQSVSKESLESAPQVLISPTGVTIPTLGAGKGEYPFSIFRPEAANGAKAKELKQALKDAVDKMSKESKTSGVLLNVVADRSVPYRDVFDTVRLFREGGYQTLMFVAMGGDNK